MKPKTTRAVLTRGQHRANRLPWYPRCVVCGHRWPCPSSVTIQVLRDLNAEWVLGMLVWADGGTDDLHFHTPIPERLRDLLECAGAGQQVRRGMSSEAHARALLLARMDRVRRTLHEAKQRVDSKGRHITVIGIAHVEEALDADL
jgi:hypothetical protein